MEIPAVRSEIETFVKHLAAETLKIPNYKITNIQTNEKGEGYMGEIFMLTISSNNQLFDIVIKAAFQDETIRQNAPIRLSFENEVHFYSTVFPQFKRLQKDEHQLELIPKCFESSLESGAEMLALQNLKVCGFETVSKASLLDDAHLRLIFKSYGRFHAYSFALRARNPLQFEEVAKGFRNVYGEFLKVEMFKGFMTQITAMVAEGLSAGEDDGVIEQFAKYMHDNHVGYFLDSIREDCEYPAILHGDSWSNNMLFKYQSDSGGDDTKKTVSELRLIDFQIAKVGSPVCDLSYCLYSGASKSEFDRLDDYLGVYHESFAASLNGLGITEDLFPLSALKSEWRKYAKFGMLMGINVIKMKLTEKEDVMDFTDIHGKISMGEIFADVRFNKEEFLNRSRQLLRHMHALGAL